MCGAELRALTLNSSLNQVSNEGPNGRTHGSTMELFIIPWKRKVCVFEAKLQECLTICLCCMDMLVLCESSASCCNFCLTMLMEGFMGTEVKRALTSSGVITSPSFQLYLLNLLYEVLSVFEIVWGLANQGANDVGQFHGHSICYGPPTGNNRA